jgi:hypothetical protein
MAWSRSQNNTGTSGTVGAGSSSVAATWGSTTSNSNLLVAGVAHDGNPGAYTPPSNWVQLGSTINNGSSYLSFWYILNAAPRSGSESFSFANTVKCNCLIIAEWSSGGASQSSDTTGNNNGNSSSPSTGNTTSTGSDDILVALLAQVSLISDGGGGTPPVFSSPTNSFSIWTNVGCKTVISSAANEIALLDRLDVAASTYSTAVTSNTSDSWAGIIGSFTNAGGGGGGGGGTIGTNKIVQIGYVPSTFTPEVIQA